MKIGRAIIFIVVMATTVLALWYTEGILSKYTAMDTITASYWENPEVLLNSDAVMNLIYEENSCDIDIWSYDNIDWNEYSSIDKLVIINHFNKNIVPVENLNESKSSRISEFVSKILYNSKEVSKEQLVINDEIYLVNAVSSSVESQKIKSFIDTEAFIVVDGQLSEATNFDKWYIRISGLPKDINEKKVSLSGYGINNTRSYNKSLLGILKMISLTRIILFWCWIGAIIYVALNLAIRFIGLALHKKAI